MNQNISQDTLGERNKTAIERPPLTEEKYIFDSQQHALNTPTELSGESRGCGELTKGPAALMVVRAHLKVQAMSWKGKDAGRVSWGSRKAEDSFLVPLGGRRSSEKDQVCPVKKVPAALKHTQNPKAEKGSKAR